MTTEASARIVMQRCDILGEFSEEPDCLTRPFASKAMHQANEAVAGWMRAAGMTVQHDKIGNLIGRYEARSAGAQTLLLGSHLDTVRNAGKYDGPPGVIVALACIERLHERQQRLPFAIEVLGFADEEGLRYQRSYLGSKAATGTFDREMLGLTDASGITMAEAIRTFGGDPDELQTANWNRDELLGYCEVHIEQGPVLEALNLAVGVVSTIAGQNRIGVCFTGEAGHAGTVPMALRHDALCASAEFVLSVETLARSLPGLVATVGQIVVQPGAGNVIPGQVTLSLDVRHQDDTLREQACRQLQERACEIGLARDIALNWQYLQERCAVACAPQLSGLLAQAIQELGYPLHTLPSGAGHDAAILANLTEMVMLFVRCRGGISHHPAESVTIEDVEVAIKVLERFLHLLSAKEDHL
ncbi:MAG: allantoate amidohydrolase [Chloroflexi bacterium]|nr:allantoate amidohydrolase [Chloroflexota bacterium]